MKQSEPKNDSLLLDEDAVILSSDIDAQINKRYAKDWTRRLFKTFKLAKLYNAIVHIAHRYRYKISLHKLMIPPKQAKPGAESAGNIQISLLCPTRARPMEMTRMWHSALDTAAHPESIEVVFYLDDDDDLGLSGLPMALTQRASQVTIVQGPRMLLSQCWNAAYEKAQGDILMHCGDDLVFRSKNWDSIVTDTFHFFPDKIAFVYGNDGLFEEVLGTHGFIHRNWINTLGYFVPPLFSSDYNDTWLNEVAEKIGRRIYIPEIYTEHIHYMNNKAAMDATYRERLIRHKQDNVERIWKDTAVQRIADAKKLYEYVKNFPAKKAAKP